MVHGENVPQMITDQSRPAMGLGQGAPSVERRRIGYRDLLWRCGTSQHSFKLLRLQAQSSCEPLQAGNARLSPTTLKKADLALLQAAVHSQLVLGQLLASPQQTQYQA
jgi:hypothetical protein